MKTTNYILFDGEMISEDAPIAGASSRGLMYGEGVFDTLRTYQNKTLFLERHLRRLRAGAEYLGISYPKHLNTQKLGENILKLNEQNQLHQKSAVIRLQLWRDGERGYSPPNSGNTHFMMTASPCPSAREAISLSTVEISRISSKSLPPDYKFTNGINYILAAKQAAEKGADDALMQTASGRISETTIANIFWQKGYTIYTPSLECDLLPGITRKNIIKLISEHPKWTLEQGAYELSHLSDAETVWICNSVRQIEAVESVNDYLFEVESDFLTELKKTYRSFVHSNLKLL